MEKFFGGLSGDRESLVGVFDFSTLRSTLQLLLSKTLGQGSAPTLAFIYRARVLYPKTKFSAICYKCSGDWTKCSPIEIKRMVVCSRKCHWTVDMSSHVPLECPPELNLTSLHEPRSNLSITLSKIDNCIIITFWIYLRYWLMWICTYHRLYRLSNFWKERLENKRWNIHDAC